MCKVVVVEKTGRILKGQYDGYGSVNDKEIDEKAMLTNEFTAYHDACWRKAGSPIAFDGNAEGSDDQGHFFAQGAHDMEEPK